ncbi:MAG: c-type cytochrome [Quisquiliibacterium sp.]
MLSNLSRAALLGSALLIFSGTALASADLATRKNCLACHAVNVKLVGPSFKDVAVKYAKDSGAQAQLAKKVRAGGAGVWGQIPMPPNPQVSDAEANTLVKWILSTK